MIYGVYTMRDEVARVFTPPVTSTADEVAIRDFRFGLASARDVRSFAPEDFSLWRIGAFDDATGIFTPAEPVLIERGEKVVSKPV